MYIYMYICIYIYVYTYVHMYVYVRAPFSTYSSPKVNKRESVYHFSNNLSSFLFENFD